MGTLGLLASLPMLPEAARLPALLGTLCVSGYAVLAYSIAVGSELAHLAPNAVPVAISINQSAFSIAAALAAAAGGAIVDAFGPGVLALGGIIPVGAAVLVWAGAGQPPPLPPGAPRTPVEPGEAL